MPMLKMRVESRDVHNEQRLSRVTPEAADKLVSYLQTAL
jgi:hypothetical protein